METFSYYTVTLPAGEHTVRVSVAENTGKGNPNIDYFDFTIKSVAEVPDDDTLTVPANDFQFGSLPRLQRKMVRARSSEIGFSRANRTLHPTLRRYCEEDGGAS